MRKFLTGKASRRFVRNNSGTTAIEYALIAAGVSIAILTAVTTLGAKIMTAFYDGLTTLF